MPKQQSAHQRLAEMVKHGEKATSQTIEPLFAQLEPASNQFMFGQWKGGNFRESTTVPRFYGKRFSSPEDCEPMLRYDDDGRVYAWKEWGDARLREISYAGKVQSAVIYDDRPLIDYFRKVDENLVIGLGDLKGRDHVNYFWLIRDTDYVIPNPAN